VGTDFEEEEKSASIDLMEQPTGTGCKRKLGERKIES